KERCRIDGCDRSLGARRQVGDVLDLRQPVLPRPETAEMASDQRLPWVVHRHVLGVYPAGDVLADGEALEGYPPGEEDIDNHQCPLPWGEYEDVVGWGVWPVKGEL